jgi:hypothetical protein
VFLKSPREVQSCKPHLPPPKAVPKRWGTWIEAINMYSEPFKTVKSVVSKLSSEPVVSFCESQSAFSDPKVPCSVDYI